MICAFIGGPPDHDARDITFKVLECQWQLTRAEFRHLSDELPPFDECGCDDGEHALANFRGGRE